MMRTSFTAIGVMFVASGAVAQDFPACERFPSGAADYACHCAADAREGSVWGTGIFTSDSDVCTAALHAGVIQAGVGGDVLALAQPGQEAYEGTQAHGITSRDWGSYGESYSFNTKGPRVGLAPDIAACEAFDVSAGRVQCSCEGGSSSGSVWGSGPYTADSDICAAAVHAGAIPQAGGVVTVIGIAGLEQYLGTERNGITSRDWGSYGNSIIFDANDGG